MKKLICDGSPPLQTFKQPRNGAKKSPAERNQRRKGRWGFAPQMQHAPNAACPKCSMPQMQHAPFRHVRVAYPRIISAPVSARIKYTNSSGNNQTMSRGEKEVSGGAARVQVAADIHRECTPSCVRERTLPCAFLAD